MIFLKSANFAVLENTYNIITTFWKKIPEKLPFAFERLLVKKYRRELDKIDQHYILESAHIRNIGKPR